MADLPEEYFCPRCNAKATHDLVEHLKIDMPTVFLVSMAMNILFEAECPSGLLKPIAEWARTYGEKLTGVNEEEKDKLKLVKWERWAKGEVK